MQPLSQQLSELSEQAKQAEDRVAKAQSEAKERLEEKRQQVRDEARAALDKVNDGITKASDATKTHFEQLKAKVDGDIQRLQEQQAEDARAFEAWQAGNLADDRAADAAAAISYAIASVKMAEVATLDAIKARGSAELKSDQAQPVQA